MHVRALAVSLAARGLLSSSPTLKRRDDCRTAEGDLLGVDEDQEGAKTSGPLSLALAYPAPDG